MSESELTTLGGGKGRGYFIIDAVRNVKNLLIQQINNVVGVNNNNNNKGVIPTFITPGPPEIHSL